MAFTDAEKTDIRRFCGFPMYGDSPSGLLAYRFLLPMYGAPLEYKMQHMLPDEETVVRDVYLTTLRSLETAVPAASENLDTDQAAVWHHNKSEVRDRAALFDEWRRRLCAFLGQSPGPFLAAAGRMVV